MTKVALALVNGHTFKAEGNQGHKKRAKPKGPNLVTFAEKKKKCLNVAKAEFSIIGMVSTETLKANNASVREALVKQGRRSQACGQCFPCSGSCPLLQDIVEQKLRHSWYWEGGRKPRDQAGNPPSHTEWR